MGSLQHLVDALHRVHDRSSDRLGQRGWPHV